jgi:hypothetical protein
MSSRGGRQDCDRNCRRGRGRKDRTSRRSRDRKYLSSLRRHGRGATKNEEYDLTTSQDMALDLTPETCVISINRIGCE